MSDLSRMRVMVVDDTETNIDILVETLGDEYKVVVATDGETALEDIEKNPPDLILLDIMMPGLDGYGVCRKLKGMEATRSIPVIFLTALKDEGDEAKGLALGAVDYITKPFNPDLVKARVRNHLDLKRHRDHLEELVDDRTREIAERQRVEYQLRSAQEKIESELTIAAQIQKSFLPSRFPAFPDCGEFDLFALIRPAREVGGDFYDFFFVDDDQLVLIIADVADKSIPAALYMMVSRTMFRSLTRQIESPSVVLAEANNLICEENETGMFITAFLARYTTSSGRLVFSNAGHNPAILTGPGNSARELSPEHGLALGIRPGAIYVDGEYWLEPGQIVFLYTDGVTEALSPQNEMFGIRRLISLLHGGRRLSLVQMLEGIDKALEAFQQGHQFDDIAMLAVKRTV